MMHLPNSGTTPEASILRDTPLHKPHGPYVKTFISFSQLNQKHFAPMIHTRQKDHEVISVTFLPPRRIACLTFI